MGAVQRGRLWPAGSLGVNSNHAQRLRVGSAAAAGCNIDAVLVLPAASGGGNDDDAGEGGCLRIACADAAGTVRVLLAPREDGCTAAALESSADFATVERTLKLPPPSGGGRVTQLTAVGQWLYAATDEGVVVGWPAL
jgi:hypothetical protein